MSRIKRNPITGDFETKDSYQIGRAKVNRTKQTMRTLRIDKETNPLGETKFHLMYKPDEFSIWSPIAFSYHEATILEKYEIAKANIAADKVSNEVIKQETL
jgi:hypothetical protein